MSPLRLLKIDLQNLRRIRELLIVDYFPVFDVTQKRPSSNELFSLQVVPLLQLVDFELKFPQSLSQFLGDFLIEVPDDEEIALDRLDQGKAVAGDGWNQTPVVVEGFIGEVLLVYFLLDFLLDFSH